MDKYGIYIPEDHIDEVLNQYQFHISQLQVCQEKCAELIQAISKYIRTTQRTTQVTTKEARDMIVGEVTHVAICLHMMQKIFGITQDEIDAKWKMKDGGGDRYV